MNRTKVEWADHSWNPITGCEQNCTRCVHQGITKNLGGGDYRLHLGRVDRYYKKSDLLVLDEEFILESGFKSDYPFGMLPTYHRYRLNRVGELKTGKNIVCGTVGEMFDFDGWCYQEIFGICQSNSQNNYLFLSHTGYEELWLNDILPQKDNVWYGSVIYTANDPMFCAKGYHSFYYINPMEDIASALINNKCHPEWIIVGTGGCKYDDRKLSKREWVENIIKYADVVGIPVFLESDIANLCHQQRNDYPELLRWESGRRYTGAIRNRMIGKCGRCSKENLKSNMITLYAREKRGQPLARIGHVCKLCFDEFCTVNNFENVIGGNNTDG